VKLPDVIVMVDLAANIQFQRTCQKIMLLDLFNFNFNFFETGSWYVAQVNLDSLTSVFQVEG
jgi:hypothetical protein